VTVPPINAASVCCGVGLVMPALARSRFARVIARSASPFPIFPVGGVNAARSPDGPVRVISDPVRRPCCRLAPFVPVSIELRASVVPVAVPFVALVLVMAVVVLTLLLLPTMLLSPVITVPPANDISTSFVAVAPALLVLVLLEVALGAVVVVGVGDVVLVVGVVDVGAAAVVGAGETGVVVAPGLVKPLPAVVPPLLVVAPLCVGDALPEPLTVTALTVVDPDALKVPAPLLVALTVVDPDALVTALCAITSGLPSAALSKAALTAVASVLFENRFWFFIVIRSPFERTS
jgi:hypothetical protein